MTPGSEHRLAIIGIGCRFPGGADDPVRFWRLLADGVDAITDVPRDRFDVDAVFDPDSAAPGKMHTRRGGFIDRVGEFDASFFGISPREAARMDPQQRILLEVAWEALEDAGLPAERLAGSKTGVFVGISSHDYSDVLVRQRNRIDAHVLGGSAFSIAANRLSYLLDLHGPSFAVDTACSSSLLAAHLACQSLVAGESDLAIVAGANVLATPETFIAFCKGGMLSPDGRCKAFDARANGYARGEGVGVVILKRLDTALADGDRIYAVILGSATNQDGRTAGLNVPNGYAQEALLRAALAASHVDPAAVQYVEAHGTGTRVGDPIELSALGRVLSAGRAAESVCLIGSVKTNIGHLEAAAGVAGLIKTALALWHGMVPPSLHFESASRPVTLRDRQLRVATELQPWPGAGVRRLAGVNSFGFGGANAHVVLEAPPAASVAARHEDHGRVLILPMSARDPDALQRLLREYRALLASGAAPAADVCYTAAVRRSHHPHRVAVVGTCGKELIEEIDALVASGGRTTADDVSPGASDRPQVAFVFTGMGLQWNGMARQLIEREPVFRLAVEQCDAEVRRLASWSLAAELVGGDSASRLTRPDVAPLANFAIQIGLVRLLASWGIHPNAAMGHSAGEIAAAFVAGAISLEDALFTALHRGRLQQRAAGTGTMLNAALSADAAAQLIAPVADRVSIATVDGPTSVSLAGDRDALQQLGAELTQRGLFNRFVAVDVPYHGPQMDRIRDEMLAVLESVRHRPSAIPFASTVTGTWIGAIPDGGAHWFDNVRQPVRFAAATTALIERGIRTFVEVGPHPALGRAISQTLAASGTDGHVLSTLRRHGDDQALMHRLLAALYAAGSDVNWGAVYPSGTFLDAPRYPWSHERYWFDPDAGSGERAGLDTGHPLLGCRLRAARPVWESDLSDGRLAYLQQHVVQQSPIMPAAGYAELALSAARQLAPSASAVVEDLGFSRAMLLSPRDGRAIQTIADPADGTFEVFSGSAHGDTSWTRHATGRIRMMSAAPEVPPHDLAALRERCTEEVSPATLYDALARRGLEYGPAFRGVAQLWRTAGEAVARLVLPEAIRPGDGAYAVHPVLLDSAFQVLFAAAEQVQCPPGGWARRYLPSAIARLTLVNPRREAAWAQAHVTRVTSEVLEGDVVVTDEAGHVLLTVASLRAEAVRDGGRDAARTWDDATYQLTWERAASVGRSAGVLSATTVGQQLQVSARQRINDGAWTVRHRALQARLDEIARHYARAALGALGWDASVGRDAGDALADRLGVTPSRRRLFARVVEIARSSERSPRSRSLSPDEELLAAERWCERLVADAAPYRAPIELLQRCGARLAAVLTGEADAREVLFSPEIGDAWARFFTDVPSYQFYNGLVADAISDAVRDAAAPLRILEIGAGTGGTTAAVLRRLGSQPVEYHFTDVSPVFVAQARERFREQPAVHTAVLDIERDPVAQLGPEPFDIVVAANVLHATADLRTSVRHARSLLAPDGLLVLFEASCAMPWSDLIFGITDGWWRFTDTDLRPRHPLLDGTRWCALLEESAFEQAVSVSEPVSDGPPIAAVILATATSHAAPTRSAPRQWIVYEDAGGVARQLAERLRARGDRVVTVRRGRTYRRHGPEAFEMAATPADARRLFEALDAEGFRGDGIIHLWALDAPTTDSFDARGLLDVEGWLCGSVASLVQASQALGRTPPDMWLVSAGAQAVAPGDRAAGVAQAPLWGIGRVLANEQRTVRCRLVDLDPDTPGLAAATCFFELEGDAANAAEEVAYRDGTRYVSRVRRVPLGRSGGAGATRACSPETTWFRLQPDAPGGFEQLVLREVPQMAPAKGEIAIRVLAVGLNFRDTLLALGLLPPIAVPGTTGTALGFECSGIITACGEGVEQFRAGDVVVALAFGACASHVITRAELAVPKPATMRVDEAATIPLAFTTAFHSLVHLARLTTGERVLIHAGTGGVGLAAIQVARWAGAEVLATAGTPEKRAYLRELGVEHVMDSRSLAFVGEVRSATAGEGVDVLLNSLSGEAIGAGLSILKPYGRFIELGKRDIHADAAIRLQPFDRSLSFITVALDQMFRDRTHLLGGVLRDVMRLVDEGTFTPLPCTTTDLAQAESALRTLARAGHIGKLVVTVQQPEYDVAPAAAAPLCRADGTYIVSGGLGGFGLAVARWLIDEGARHVLLVSRTGTPAPVNQSAFAALSGLGAEVHTCRGDIAEPSGIARLRELLEALPPVRGVVHAAMVLEDTPLEDVTPEGLERVLAPKIAGAWNLHQLALAEPIEFFVMFSSLTSVIGTPGQASYAAANAFLDSLTAYRRGCGLPSLTINWGVLSDVGYVAARPELAEQLRRYGTDRLTSAEALQILRHALRHDVPQLIAARMDWQRWSGTGATASPRLAGVVDVVRAGADDATRDRTVVALIAEADPAARAAVVETYVTEQVARVLGTSPGRVPANQPLAGMGLDSLMGVELRLALERGVGVQVPLEWVLEGITVQDLASRLLASLTLTVAEKRGNAPDLAPKVASEPLPRVAVDAAGSAPAPPVPAPSAPSLPEPATNAVVVAERRTSAAGPRSRVPSRRPIDYATLDYGRWSTPQQMARACITGLFRAGAALNVEGLHHVPRSGPVVLAANHLSMLDVPLIFTLLDRPAVCLAADRLQRVPFARLFLDIGQSIYVHRGEADQEALQSASAVLVAGGMLAIAPEGTRSRSGGLARGQPGMVRLAAATGAVILPVAAWGQEQVVSNLKRLRRTRIDVRVGQPLAIAPRGATAAAFQEETDRVMRAIAQMLPARYRGVYAGEPESELAAAFD